MYQMHHINFDKPILLLKTKLASGLISSFSYYFYGILILQGFTFSNVASMHKRIGEK